MKFAPILLAAVLMLGAAGSSRAASSEPYDVEGGSIRLVTNDSPDENGVLRGALEIRLQPGWKTYWRDPGDSGVPPTIDITVAGKPATVEIGFPAPKRFDDGYSIWAGYDEPLSLALTIRMPEGSAGGAITADAFLGVCETICIPVGATLTAIPGADGNRDARIVADAFAALPGPASDELRARMTELEDDGMVVEVTAPENVGVEALFVAGTETLALGVPEERDGEASAFTVPVLRRGEAAGRLIHYTLVTSGGAVSGTWKQR